MNFEVIDNLMQTVVLMICAVISAVQAFRYKERSLIILAFGYACFCMGTLFWGMFIAIRGDVPSVFYVSEISWIAAYFFYLSLQILRISNARLEFSAVAAICAGLTAAVVLCFRIMGPSWFVSGLFALTASAIMYLSVFSLSIRTSHKKTDICFVCCIVLQICLYVVSAFMSDFTRFNLYFAVDMTLSICFAVLLPLIISEVKNK